MSTGDLLIIALNTFVIQLLQIQKYFFPVGATLLRIKGWLSAF